MDDSDVVMETQQKSLKTLNMFNNISQSGMIATSNNSLLIQQMALEDMKLRGKKILVAEDLVYNQIALKNVFLRNLGMSAIDFEIFESCNALITYVQDTVTSFNPYSMILLDYKSPEMNGIQAAQTIIEIFDEREISERPKIAFLSAYISDDLQW